jgi:hypothetical protein
LTSVARLGRASSTIQSYFPSQAIP